MLYLNADSNTLKLSLKNSSKIRILYNKKLLNSHLKRFENLNGKYIDSSLSISCIGLRLGVPNE